MKYVRQHLMVALLVLLFALFLRTCAHAHEAKRPDLNEWFEHLRSGNGPCCSNMDGTALSDVDWETKDGHYRVRLKGRWVDVPDDAVITEPNRAGVTMVWPHYLNGGADDPLLHAGVDDLSLARLYRRPRGLQGPLG